MNGGKPVSSNGGEGTKPASTEPPFMNGGKRCALNLSRASSELAICEWLACMSHLKKNERENERETTVAQGASVPRGWRGM